MISGSRRLSVALVALALAVAACGGDRTSAGGPSEPALRPIVLPNLSGVDERARSRLEAAQARVTAGSAGSAAAGDLAAAYGDLGLLLMASEFVDAAEPSLANASALAPDDPRWAYYLAHAHKRRGDIEQAASGFERVLAIAPDTRVAVWWLGAMRLEQGRTEEAEALFSRVREDPAFELAARYGLGRAALLRQDYQSAATHLEAVLALNREAVAAHYPLGLAYRGLGRTADAEAHMRRRSGTDILPPDPWIDTLAGLVETAEAHYGLGVEASRAGAWAEAADAFRRALELDPRHGPARVNLSVALYRLNDEAGALAEAARALAVPGSEARAHFVMGTIHALAGRDTAARAAYDRAIQADPALVEAHLGLAHALRRQNRPADALPHYESVLRLAPADAEAQFGAAIAEVRLGRHAEARRRLDAGAASHPNDPRFAHALARLLAASPDSAVRDGRRAVTIMEALLAAQPTVDRARTLAMALAETGRFSDAVELQRRAVAAATEGGDGAAARQMTSELRAYERRQPTRTPWAPDDSIFFPPPLDAPGGPGARP